MFFYAELFFRKCLGGRNIFYSCRIPYSSSKGQEGDFSKQPVDTGLRRYGKTGGHRPPCGTGATLLPARRLPCFQAAGITGTNAAIGGDFGTEGFGVFSFKIFLTDPGIDKRPGQ